MQALRKGAYWGATAALAVLAAGCVGVDTEPAPSRFQCESPGQVPLEIGGGWSCVAPDSLAVSASFAPDAGTAADAGTASYATHAKTAEVAEGFATSASTIHLTSAANPSQVQVDAPFRIQGFPVPSLVSVKVLDSYALASGSVAIGNVPLPTVTGAKIRIRLTGRVYDTLTAPEYQRCDLEVDGVTAQGNVKLAVLPVTASNLGTTVHLERVVDDNGYTSLDALVVAGAAFSSTGNPAECQSTGTSDLTMRVEVIR